MISFHSFLEWQKRSRRWTFQFFSTKILCRSMKLYIFCGMWENLRFQLNYTRQNQRNTWTFKAHWTKKFIWKDLFFMRPAATNAIIFVNIQVEKVREYSFFCLFFFILIHLVRWNLLKQAHVGENREKQNKTETTEWITAKEISAKKG